MPAPLDPEIDAAVEEKMHPADAECSLAWGRFVAVLMRSGVDLSKICNAAHDYALARAKARESIGRGKWQPGDRRCESCDSGLEREWDFCPFCWADIDDASSRALTAAEEARETSRLAVAMWCKTDGGE